MTEGGGYVQRKRERERKTKITIWIRYDDESFCSLIHTIKWVHSFPHSRWWKDEGTDYLLYFLLLLMSCKPRDLIYSMECGGWREQWYWLIHRNYLFFWRFDFVSTVLYVVALKDLTDWLTHWRERHGLPECVCGPIHFLLFLNYEPIRTKQWMHSSRFVPRFQSHFIPCIRACCAVLPFMYSAYRYRTDIDIRPYSPLPPLSSSVFPAIFTILLLNTPLRVLYPYSSTSYLIAIGMPSLRLFWP